MFFQNDLKITKVDNGYVLEWHRGEDELESTFGDKKQKTRGTEVHEDMNELLKRVRALLL